MRKTGNALPVKAIYHCLIIAAIGLFSANIATAMPPHPSLLEARAADEAAGKSLTPLPNPDELHARGIDTPENCFNMTITPRSPERRATSIKRFRVLAILVDFDDNVSQTEASFFDTLVFGPGSGSVADYFDEISYGKIDIVTVNMPSTTGWNRAPQTYAHYVGSPGNHGMGPYPNNSQGLVEDLVDAVDSVVDFSLYDNDGNGFVDMLVVIHAGTGAELSGDSRDMWSHEWGIAPRQTGEGTYVSTFTVQPEFWYGSGDMTIGAYCHELLHGFGLPDLYDTDNTSYGIGRWGVMASGSWNGSLGNSPSHPSAWSRIEMGITKPKNVTSNRMNHNIKPINRRSGAIYRLWTNGAMSNEYFLVENRQRIGYDAFLPNGGLLIWHIDDSKTNNRQEWYPGAWSNDHNHYLVALEQADGLYELEHKNGSGDNSDCWPGALDKTAFNATSSPSSDGYKTGGSLVAVENITVGPKSIRADLLVGSVDTVDENVIVQSEPFNLNQNSPNPFNPSTTISFDLAEASKVKLEVFNVLGQRVQSLIDDHVGPGTVSKVWDATDQSGSRVASGIYFYKLMVNGVKGTEQTKKMLLLK